MPFFCFDGIDGAGKTTQINRFRDWLESQSIEVLLCRDPGTTPLGEQLRDLLLSHSGTPIDMRAEMFLYMTARVQLVEEVIRPALAAGKTVISDRYLLANVVYQGHAGGLSAEKIWQVGELATDGILPELTFVLDLNPDAAAARRVGAPDRVEGRGDEFLRKVRDGFLLEAESREEIVIIDASASPDDVQSQIQAAASKWFALGEQR